MLFVLFYFVVQYTSVKNHNAKVTIEDLPPILAKLKAFNQSFKEEDIKEILSESASDMNQEIEFEDFLKVRT